MEDGLIQTVFATTLSPRQLLPWRTAKMVYLGHTLMENRNGLIIKAQASLAAGRAERETSIVMVSALNSDRHKTLGADKDYDMRECVAAYPGT